MIKKILFVTIFSLSNLWAESFTIDSAHTKIEFKIPYLKVSSVTGSFNKYQSTFNFDPKTKSLDNILVEIEATSIDTGIDARDNHLRNQDFFDVPNHPKITFKTKEVIKDGNNQYILKGDMTLRGVTKEQSFALAFNEPIEDMMGNLKYPFKATTIVDRKAYNIGWNKQTKHGTWVLGEKVEVTIEGLAMANKK